MCSLLNKKIKVDFKKNASDVLSDRLMLYGDFMDLTSDERKYLEIIDREEVISETANRIRSCVLAFCFRVWHFM